MQYTQPKKQTNNNTCLGAYLYFNGIQRGNLRPIGWPILFFGPTQEPVLATINTGKIGDRFEKNADELTRTVEISGKSLAVNVACMAIYWPTPGFKERTFKLCVLKKWDFNFCVRSSLLRGSRVECPRKITSFQNMCYCFVSGFAFRNCEYNSSCSLRKRDEWYNGLWNE